MKDRAEGSRTQEAMLHRAALVERLRLFLAPLLSCLDARQDKRLVQVIISFRHASQGLC